MEVNIKITQKYNTGGKNFSESTKNNNYISKTVITSIKNKQIIIAQNINSQSMLNLNQKKINPKKIGEITQKLIIIGYPLDSIKFCYEKYKFEDLDKALFIMTKDSETNKYHHSFFSIKQYQLINRINSNNFENNILNNKNKYNLFINSNLKKINNEDVCIICRDLEKYHENIFNNNVEVFSPKYKEKKDISNKYLNNSFSIQNKNLIENISSYPLIEQKNLNGLNICNKNNDDINYNNHHHNPKTQIKINKDLINKILEEIDESKNLCLICFNNELLPTNSTKFPCSHQFCNKCISFYIKDKIDSSEIKIKCLMAGCLYILSEEIIQQFIDDETFKKYIKFKKRAIFKENISNNLIPCIYPDCEEWVKYTEGDDINVQCSLGHKFCAKCKENQHPGKRCHFKEISNLINKKSRIKLCPNCNNLIEKNGGCNKIICPLCEYAFCWICLGKYTNYHYYMFNINGCPGMKYTDPKRSKILNNCFISFLYYLMCFFLMLFVIIFLGILYLLFGASYKLIKYYIERKKKKQQLNFSVSSIEDGFDFHNTNNGIQDLRNNPNLEINNINNSTMYNNNTGGISNYNDNKKFTFKKYLIYFSLFLLGLILQPFFLVYKILQSIMELYKRLGCCGCWFFFMGRY